MGPCIVRILQYISNKTQRYTVYYIWKLLYVFQVVSPPIIRSANNCIYSIWYLSQVAAGSSNGLASTQPQNLYDLYLILYESVPTQP